MSVPPRKYITRKYTTRKYITRKGKRPSARIAEL